MAYSSFVFRPLFFVLAGMLAGRLAEAEAQGPKIKVFVTILPQAFFVERVGGDRVEARVLVGPGQSPHTYEPTPKQMAELAETQIYFAIGVPFEARLLQKIRASFPNLKIVDTSRGIRLRRMDEAGAPERKEEPVAGGPAARDEDEEPGSADPHVWLDPSLVKIMAQRIGEALGQADPAHAAEYEKNQAAFDADLDAVDQRIAQALAPLKGRKFYVFHPAFGYFADRYGLKQAAVETGGREPGARDLAALIEHAKQDKVKVIFVQPQFSSRSAEAVAKAIGGAVIPLDDLAGDYLANLERVARKIEEGLKGEP